MDKSKEIDQGKKRKNLCEHCKYRKPSVFDDECSGEKSNVVDCYIKYGVKWCDQLEYKGDEK